MDRQYAARADTANDQETALWLALLNSKKLERRTAKALINAWCVRDQRRLSDLHALATSELAEALGLAHGDAAQVVEALAGDASLSMLRQLRRDGIAVITRVDAAYPEELSAHLSEEALPYVLYVHGALDVLSEGGVAVGGRHDASALDDSVLAQLAQSLVGGAMPAIGGFDRGVDRELVLRTATSGGQAVAILPLGLAQAGAILTLAQPALHTDSLLLLSPFPPDTPFSDRTALARLPLITGLANALLLLDPDASPDDLVGADALQARGAPIVVVSRQDSVAVQRWAAFGAAVVDGPATVGERLAVGNVALRPKTDNAAADLPGVEPIYFDDADQAIEILGRSGQVPPALARRLRESSVFGYQDVPDVDIDWDATEQEQEGSHT